MPICVVERKSFKLSCVSIRHSEFVRITERGSGYAVFVKIRESLISWLVDLLREARHLSEREKLVKTKNKGDRVIVFHRKRNDRGRFIVLSVTPRSSRGRHIIILDDFKDFG